MQLTEWLGVIIFCFVDERATYKRKYALFVIYTFFAHQSQRLM